MNKLIEHPEFISAVSWIWHAAFGVGKESDRSGLKAEVDSGSYNPNASDSWSNHTTSLNDALIAFATIDYASLLGLGHLDMVGMRRLCALENVGELSNNILIEGVGGGSGGNGGGAAMVMVAWKLVVVII